MVVRRRVERIERSANRRRQVGLAARGRFGRGAFQGRAQKGMVGRERTQQHTRAAERHERAAIAFEGIDKIGNVGLGALQAVGPHVRHEH